MMSKGSGCVKCPVKNCGIFVRYGGARCAMLRNRAGTYRDPTTNAEAMFKINMEFSCFECTGCPSGTAVKCDGDCAKHYLEWMQLPYDPGVEVSS